MKIAGIEFPGPLLTALRNRKLVVFAGTGVSMGEPAWLPDFKKLAIAIAEGHLEALQDDEPEDRFLGRLHHKRVQVHSLASEILQTNLRGETPKPTDLHRDLLRLYPEPEATRIVTTNFDLLFEGVTTEAFGSNPEMFRAPALPLGGEFNGIVHIHGALDRPGGMVLTDADFGRAYLTEGWARRFLVELFHSFTVLFVGYSHNDTIMNYLARALPESKKGSRFALTDQADHSRWQIHGIEPISYQKTPGDDYTALYKGVAGLARHMSRGVLDWQREITELAKKGPPLLDEEKNNLIAEALSDATKLRFFADAETPPEWIGWLDERQHLDALFGRGVLSKQDGILAWWLAERFASRYADELFRLIARHNTRLHPDFWWKLGRKIESDKQGPLDGKNLSRWVSLLLATAPVDAEGFVLASMGKRCARDGLIGSLLHVFDVVAGNRLLLKPSSAGSDDDQVDPSVKVDLPLVGDHHGLSGLRELWETISKLNLAKVAEPLLEIVIRRLEERHFTRRTWQDVDHEWDPDSSHRSAIEPHEQNGRLRATDNLIDAARDCLEWLAANQAGAATRWCDQLAGSNAPLLRRLAVHTLSACTELKADQKISWLLKHVDLHDSPARHEIFRTAKLAYPGASSERREALIESVLTYHWPDEKDPDKKQRAAYYHFNWLHWLCDADPNCTLAKEALKDIQSKHSSFQPTEHPDFKYWTSSSNWAGPQSPWTTEQLLEKPAKDWLLELLSFHPKEFFGPDRDGLVLRVQAAAGQQFDWGLDLAEVLARAGEWDVDLWAGLIWAWSKMELDEHSYRRVLDQLGRIELYPTYAREIAAMLCALVKDQGTPYAFKLLSQANKIAGALWHDLDRDEPSEKPDDWLEMAIGQAAGILAEFWLGSLGIWYRQQKSRPQALNNEYSKALLDIVQDGTVVGRLGRSVLANRFNFLLEVDKAWTKENLLPSFYAESDTDDFQATWDGFLIGGKLNPSVAEHLGGAFLKAVQQKDRDLGGQRGSRFVKRYTAMLGSFSENPLEEGIPQLFGYRGVEVPPLFASEVGRHLHGMDEARQREWWTRWLRRYWKNRLRGVPVCLESVEVERMLGWLPDLTAVFPEAVALATCMLKLPIERLERGYGVINKLNESASLVQDHPKEIAQLLIELGRLDTNFSPLWYGGQKLIDQLLQSDLSLDLAQGLEELKAKRGL